MTDQPKIILITGSTDGVGRRVAEKLAVAGNKILIHGRSHQRGEDLVRFIRSKGADATFFYADFASHDEVRRLAADIAAAVAALAPILASELRPLRVNGVSPEVIDTPWWDFLSEEDKSTVFDEYAGKTPVGRVGSPDDIAETLRFLITSTFVSDQTIICDGGLHLGKG
ncbi:SDR family oxidoreductase [Raoultella terrigena]|uniref:SDR family oxidoreductase n=1 Tax=Raoultella terrigena TaxID=577 RepID=UPI0025B18E80|nr:SDR family oxidoreductase [Raoultella terrigena]WJV38576.1 SDR family oxidoreductase [Raoultella terrigena]